MHLEQNPVSQKRQSIGIPFFLQREHGMFFLKCSNKKKLFKNLLSLNIYNIKKAHTLNTLCTN